MGGVKQPWPYGKTCLAACLLVLGGSLALTSCEGDAFTKVVDVDLDTPEPIPVLYADWSTADTVLQVFVSETVGALSDTLARPLAGVQVVALLDGEATDVFDEVPIRFSSGFNAGGGQAYYYVHTLDEPLRAGTDVQVTATLPDGRALSARDQFPEQVHIEPGRFEPPTFDTIDFGDGSLSITQRGGAVSLLVNDPGGVANYYRFAVDVEYRDSVDFRPAYSTELYAVEEDTRWTRTYGGRILRDLSFDGSRVEVDFEPDVFGFGGAVDSTARYLAFARLYTEAAFLYLRDRSALDESEFNPFAEPVVLSSNVDGGLGHLLLHSESERVELR